MLSHSRARANSWPAAVSAGIVSLVMVVGIFLATAHPSEADEPATLHIGLSSRIFQEIPEAQAKEALQLLKTLVKTQTGYANESTIEPDVEKMARDLAQNKLDFGFFLGFEFAWARQKNPKLLPLAIALISADPHLRAHVMTRHDSPFMNLSQLKGKSFGIPTESRAHCRLFVERQCKAQGKPPRAFFAKLTAPATLEDALDDVVDGVVQATIMDDFGLEVYKRRKPGRFTKLKEIQSSEVFPLPVVAYQPGTFNEATLKRFRDDLIRANQDADGQRLLTSTKLLGFAQIPDDYEETVTAIGKAYPQEAEGDKSK